MRRKLVVLALAATFVVGLAPAANAGPWWAVCVAVTNAYEKTGQDAPWACLA